MSSTTSATPQVPEPNGPHSGLASMGASPRFSRAGGVYTTTDYQTAANRLDLELKAGVSSISIR